MNISLRLPQGDVDLDITAATDATVGDLLHALLAAGWSDLGHGGPAGADDSTVLVNGHRAPADHALEEVGCTDGAVVQVVASGTNGDALIRPGHATRATRAFHGGVAVRLGVAGGLESGRWIDAPAGRHRIGRGSDALVGHATTSDRHATVDVEFSGRVTIVDHGSRNGTWVDGRSVARSHHVEAGALVRTGAMLSKFDDLARHDRPSDAGRAFNRPPRPAPGPMPAPLRAPRAPTSNVGTKPTLPIASVVGGVAMGAVMFLVTGTLAYAALAFLTPIITVFGALAGRRRHGRDARRQAVTDRRELEDFAAQVEATSDLVAARMRSIHPDLAEVVRRATAPSIRLWERRLDHPDALHLVVGHATQAWDPPLQTDGPVAGEVAEVVRERAWLREAPVVAPGGVIGIVGDRVAALAVARGLVVQAAVHHGPADLEALLVTPDVLAWDGAKWLPHLQDPVHGRPRAADPLAGRDLLAAVLARRSGLGGDSATAVPTLLVVLDGVETCEGREAPGRAVLRGAAGPVLGIVVAETVDQLPASCDTVIAMEGRDGACRVTRPGEAIVVKGVLAAGVQEPTLATTARALARFDDPEAGADRDLPTLAALPDLCRAAPTTGERVRRLWQEQRAQGRLRTPIGMSADGPLIIDLQSDGPHALVAGTTGAGKSELLRSLVAGLAANADPDHVAFVLVDYKGGAAFDRCADLPHVAGLVTDLDDDLAERALTCLQAELHRRERLLRAQAVADLDAYRRKPVAAEVPLPDLVVVIDEFATMAAELPDFLDALVGIAQRGRSLGVHLVLATQRPSGVVSEDIRANTNLRIALRVQDRQDSTDVIEDGAAATLTRDQPGRAFVRLGPGNLVAIQSALVTGPARGRDERVVVRPFGLAGPGSPASSSVDTGVVQTDLDVLVAAVREAFEAEGLRRPREPWPAALPSHLGLAEFRDLQVAACDAPELLEAQATDGGAIVDETTSTTIAVALADDPEHQRRRIVGWDLADGGLLLVGGLGSGATSTLSTVVLQATASMTPDQLHVHVLDAGRGDLEPLAPLPHVSSVVRVADAERVGRLVALLGAEVDRRRRGGHHAQDPTIVVALDDWEGIVAANDGGAGLAMVDDLMRVIVEGPAVGVVTAMTVGRPGGVNSRLLSTFAQRWILRLPDDADGAMLGVPRGVAALPPGRAIDAATGARHQVVRIDDLASEVARRVASAITAREGPAPIRCLPATVIASTLPASSNPTGRVWTLPLGVRGDDLSTASLELHPGEHGLVVGPSRSGRSTVLRTLAVTALRGGLRVLWSAGRPGGTMPVGVESVDPADLAGRLSHCDSPTLVLVDDADLVDVSGLDAAVAAVGPDVRIVAAGRADAIRQSYGHWTRGLARSRAGVLLAPDLDLDGDLFGVRLPRHAPAPAAPGRGWLATGGQVVQCQPAGLAPEVRDPDDLTGQAARVILADVTG